MPKYNTMFDIAFTVEHDCEDPHDVPADQLLAGMSRRIRDLRQHEAEVKEAVGVCDTYNNEEEGCYAQGTTDGPGPDSAAEDVAASDCAKEVCTGAADPPST